MSPVSEALVYKNFVRDVVRLPGGGQWAKVGSEIRHVQTSTSRKYLVHTVHSPTYLSSSSLLREHKHKLEVLSPHCSLSNLLVIILITQGAGWRLCDLLPCVEHRRMEVSRRKTFPAEQTPTRSGRYSVTMSITKLYTACYTTARNALTQYITDGQADTDTLWQIFSNYEYYHVVYSVLHNSKKCLDTVYHGRTGRHRHALADIQNALTQYITDGQADTDTLWQIFSNYEYYQVVYSVLHNSKKCLDTVYHGRTGRHRHALADIQNALTQYITDGQADTDTLWQIFSNYEYYQVVYSVLHNSKKCLDTVYHGRTGRHRHALADIQNALTQYITDGQADTDTLWQIFSNYEYYQVVYSVLHNSKKCLDTVYHGRTGRHRHALADIQYITDGQADTDTLWQIFSNYEYYQVVYSVHTTARNALTQYITDGQADTDTLWQIFSNYEYYQVVYSVLHNSKKCLDTVYHGRTGRHRHALADIQ
ncbi:hypothetical protein J6590_078004 [Homalodisca vitripennis]|nr:hypothetical protein J6590_078004 [Homalodisca vitripennis]